MPASVKVDDREVLIGLGEFKAAATDIAALLRICGVLMRASITRTFREEGSPAGSWPKLAASTLKHRGYTTGHKLLILSGRLFGSITYVVANGVLTIGTALVYAAVQQWGSRDYMGGAAGPRTSEQMVKVGEHQGSRIQQFRRYGTELRADKTGKVRRVRLREQGPSNATRFSIGAHTRRQNIPGRPFVVIRPEDPDRLSSGVQAFLNGKAARFGKVGLA
jgi:phage gpG-like protein